MNSDYLTAVNEMYKLFYDAWNIEAQVIVGYTPEVMVQGFEKETLPDQSKFWVRLSQRTISEEQVTFSNSHCKKYESNGILFIQLFCPKNSNQSYEKAKQLAIIARNAYRGKTTDSSVWFLNVRINELDDEENWFRFNIIAEYKYDENA